MTEKLEPDEKTIASLNASLEKCWNDAENPLPYIPLVVPPIEVPEFNFFGNGKEWHTEKKDEYTTPATPASTPRDTLQADGADELDFIMGQSLNNMMMEEQRKPVRRYYGEVTETETRYGSRMSSPSFLGGQIRARVSMRSR